MMITYEVRRELESMHDDLDYLHMHSQNAPEPPSAPGPAPRANAPEPSSVPSPGTNPPSAPKPVKSSAQKKQCVEERKKDKIVYL